MNIAILLIPTIKVFFSIMIDFKNFIFLLNLINSLLLGACFKFKLVKKEINVKTVKKNIIKNLIQNLKNLLLKNSLQYKGILNQNKLN